ncbi:hypothetical protein acdb102_29560 [Acidothermaceae bacterium B102]|nr:hypothetical protein acdb102_29560 [Acidothermaceae bacterium B102]
MRSEGVGGWGLVLVVAVVAALFSMLSQPQRGSSSPAPGVLPSAPPSASAAASTPPSSATPVVPSGPPPISLNATQSALLQTSGFVSAIQICHVTTDHRTTLDISLILRNDTQVTELLEELSPALPLGGLKDRGVVVRSGTCASPFGKPAKAAGQVLPSNTTVLITLHLGLPKTCPQPLPVNLDVTVSIDGNIRAEQLPLYPDLGSFTFTTCHPTT